MKLNKQSEVILEAWRHWLGFFSPWVGRRARGERDTSLDDTLELA